MRAMKPLCSGINVSTNAGSNARISPDLPDQQKQLTGRSHEFEDRAICSGVIELRLSCGRSLHFDSAVDGASLTRVIRAVEAA